MFLMFFALLFSLIISRWRFTEIFFFFTQLSVLTSVLAVKRATRRGNLTRLQFCLRLTAAYTNETAENQTSVLRCRQIDSCCFHIQINSEKEETITHDLFKKTVLLMRSVFHFYINAACSCSLHPNIFVNGLTSSSTIKTQKALSPLASLPNRRTAVRKLQTLDGFESLKYISDVIQRSGAGIRPDRCKEVLSCEVSRFTRSEIHLARRQVRRFRTNRHVLTPNSSNMATSPEAVCFLHSKKEVTTSNICRIHKKARIIKNLLQT